MNLVSLLRAAPTAGLLLALLLSSNLNAGLVAVALVPTVEPAGKTFALSPNPTAVPTLNFDLTPIPPGAVITSAALRLIPKAAGLTDQLVRILPGDTSTSSIGTVTVSFDATEAESSGPGLKDALNQRSGPTLTLRLHTPSASTQRDYYTDKATTPANRPRLLISWTDPQPAVVRDGAQLSHAGSPGVTPWIHADPSGARVTKLTAALGFTAIKVGPVFRREDILLVATTTAEGPPMLYGLGWNGQKRWELALPTLGGEEAWKYALLDEQQRLLLFASDGKLHRFEFDGDGRAQPPDEKSLPAAPNQCPVISPGGTLVYLDTEGMVRALGPWPGLVELWQSDCVKGSQGPAPVLSPRGGDDLVYVLGGSPKSKEDAALKDVFLFAFDALRGTPRATLPFPRGSSPALTALHPPFTTAGASHDWVFVSGYSESAGALEAYTDLTAKDPGRWKDPIMGTISRGLALPPVARTSPDDPLFYAVMNGQFCGINFAAKQTHSADSNLRADSNLVADGAGNVYFWHGTTANSGALFGFTRASAAFLRQPLAELGAAAQFVLGPNGVLYATSSSTLFAVEPTTPALPHTELAANTRYAIPGHVTVPAGQTFSTAGPVAIAAAGALTVGAPIPAGADVTATATSMVSFQPGFAVARGAVLRVALMPAAVPSRQ